MDLLHEAIRNNHIEAAMNLLEFGAETNVYHTIDGARLTPLHSAISLNEEAMVLLLLHFGADANLRDADEDVDTRMVHAVRAASLGIVKMLLGTVDRERWDHTLLEPAIKRAALDETILKYLLEEGWDPNIAQTRLKPGSTRQLERATEGFGAHQEASMPATSTAH